MRKNCGNRVLRMGLCKIFYTCERDVILTTADKSGSFTSVKPGVFQALIPKRKFLSLSVLGKLLPTFPNTNNKELLINNLVFNRMVT